MVERINLLLKAKNITARQFAEEIGVQPSGMSHILSGRNNPSLDFVMKVMKRWPEVNINWLMFGKGEMFVAPPLNAPLVQKSDENEGDFQDQPHTEEYDLFSQPQVLSVEEPEGAYVPDEEGAVPPAVQGVPTDNESQEKPQVPAMPHPSAAEIVHTSQNSIDEQPHENCVDESKSIGAVEKKNLVKKKIERIVVFYEDRTFCEYLPE